MAKRLTDTDKWKDDWYISLNNDSKIIWQWLLDNCDHAGICKRSISLINLMCKVDITEEYLLESMKGRLIVHNDYWFIPKFLKFQYSTLLSNKPMIVSVVKLLFMQNLTKLIPKSFGNDYVIISESFKNHLIMIKKPLGNDSEIVKDKDINIDIDTDIDLIKNGAAKKNEILEPLVPLEDEGDSLGSWEFDWEFEKENFLNDQIWKEQFCMKKDIEIKVLENKMKLFVDDCELSDKKRCSELKRHFLNKFNKNGATVPINGQPVRKRKMAVDD